MIVCGIGRGVALKQLSFVVARKGAKTQSELGTMFVLWVLLSQRTVVEMV